MIRITVEVKKENDKSYFIYNIFPTQSEDFGVINPFEGLPYELKSESEIKQIVTSRLNMIGFKFKDDEIEVKY